MHLTQISPDAFLESLRFEKEQSALAINLRVKLYLHIASIIVPAAYQAAANGNVLMRDAVERVERETGFFLSLSPKDDLSRPA